VEPLFDEKEENIEGYLAIRIDITHIVELERKIELEVEKNKEKDKQMIQQSKLAQMGEMLSMIAHQWRQPLSAISATSNSIGLKAHMGKLDNKTAIELSDKINNYTQHLSTTIDDFRNFFKKNKTKESITLEQIVSDTLDIIRPSLENLNIKVILDFNSHMKIDTYVNELK